MPYALFDRHAYPQITITFTGENATDDTFADYLNETSANYNSGEKITILFDATKASFPSLRHQKMQARWLKEHEDLMRNYCLGIAYTIPNSLIRKALQLIFKIQKQPVPFKVVASNKQGYEWLEKQLKA